LGNFKGLQAPGVPEARWTAKRSLQFGHLQGRQGIAVGNMALQAAAV